METSPFGEFFSATDIVQDNLSDSGIVSEEEFLSMLDTNDEMDETNGLGLSLLDNNHDLIDMMTPLFASPFPAVPYDDLDFNDSGFHNTYMNEHVTENNEPDTPPTYSPLKQLLLSKSNRTNGEPATGQEENLENSLVSRGNKRSSRSSRTLKSNANNSKRQTRKTRSTRTDVLKIEPEIKECSKTIKVSKERLKRNVKGVHISKALKFPPCSVCGGKASGLHYGVNSCEACKGFFRRFIIRNEEYKCAKDGNCKVVNKNRENCSGCRLKKCLALGMSKENCKLGRYSLSRRTETIKKVNVLEGKEKHSDRKHFEVNLISYKFDHTYSEESGKSSPCLQDIVPADCSPESLIRELICAMDEIQPYGPSIVTTSEIQNLINQHHQRYQTKLQTYGEMKAVPKDEYYKLLKEYGIDVDGRIQKFKEYVMKIKRLTDGIFNFAHQIPGFKKLQSRDQTNLLNAFRCDFFIILMHEGYNEEYGIILARNGIGYHINEIADRCFSRKLITAVCEAYARFQRLSLSKEEKCLLLALTLTYTDRSNLEDADFVDKIQFLVSEVIRYQLERTLGSRAQHRFTKFIDCLVFLREVSEQYMLEFRQLCKDETMVREIPTMTELLIDEW